jgi:deazaflavin-dependent oxidoreductase (nitroreductase family)
VAKTYSHGPTKRAVNGLVKKLTRVGMAGRHTYVLVVRGRKTGRVYTTPVTLIENGQRWLVSPYGEVAWVRNARAAGQIELRRAGRSETLAIEPVTPDQAAPVLQRYLKEVSIVRAFFDVTPDDSAEAFAREAPRHPVFRLTDTRTG